jgi:hypothetical protein
MRFGTAVPVEPSKKNTPRGDTMSARLRPSRGLFAVAIALTGLPGAARAETPQDNWWGELEFYYPTINSTARLDFPQTERPGTETHLEDDLGLSDRDGTPYLLLGTRLGQNWRIEFEYYLLERRGDRAISREIHWGDIDFPVSAQIHSVFDTNVYRLVGGYSFYRTPMAEAGASLGLHVTQFKIGLSGVGNGPNGEQTFQSETKNVLVPLPTLGLYGTYKFNDAWMMRGRFDFLSLTIDQYNGQLVNSMFAVDWRFTPNWGAGLGYRYVSYNLKSTTDKFHGEVKYDFKGPTIFVEAGF